jgi:hypothetical protein
MTEQQPDNDKRTVAIAVDRDAYSIARNMSRRNGVTRKVWVSNAIRIAAAISASCKNCDTQKETR